MSLYSFGRKYRAELRSDSLLSPRYEVAVRDGDDTVSYKDIISMINGDQFEQILSKFGSSNYMFPDRSRKKVFEMLFLFAKAYCGVDKELPFFTGVNLEVAKKICQFLANNFNDRESELMRPVLMFLAKMCANTSSDLLEQNDESIDYLKRAAKLGNATALALVVDFYLKKNDFVEINSICNRDEDNVIKVLMELVDFYHKGRILDEGRRFDIDLSKVRELYEIAASKYRHSDSLLKLAEMYESGEGGAINKDKANELRQQAKLLDQTELRNKYSKIQKLKIDSGVSPDQRSERQLTSLCQAIETAPPELLHAALKPEEIREVSVKLLELRTRLNSNNRYNYSQARCSDNPRDQRLKILASIEFDIRQNEVLDELDKLPNNSKKKEAAQTFSDELKKIVNKFLRTEEISKCIRNNELVPEITLKEKQDFTDATLAAIKKANLVLKEPVWITLFKQIASAVLSCLSIGIVPLMANRGMFDLFENSTKKLSQQLDTLEKEMNDQKHKP